MPKDKHGRTRLSKSVLDMKFMQRSKQRMLAEKEAEETQAMHSKDITEGMKSDTNSFELETSYVPCLDLILGRLSYGGINPEVEKLMKPRVASTQPSQYEMEKDVSDWEMLKRTNMAQVIANKFNTKKDKNKVFKRMQEAYES